MGNSVISVTLDFVLLWNISVDYREPYLGVISDAKKGCLEVLFVLRVVVVDKKLVLQLMVSSWSHLGETSLVS